MQNLMYRYGNPPYIPITSVRQNYFYTAFLHMPIICIGKTIVCSMLYMSLNACPQQIKAYPIRVK